MLELLRDPVWQFIGAILGIISILAAIIIFLLQRNKKQLVYEIIAKTPLLNVSQEIENKVQILYEGKTVTKVHLIVIEFTNNGNIPITTSDYHAKVSITFTNTSKILSSSIDKTEPDSINPTINTQDSSIILEPTLLNSGDAIRIKALVSDFDEKTEIRGRLVGVKGISKRITKVRQSSIILISMGLIILALAGFTSLVIQNSDLFNIMVGTAYIIMFIPILIDTRFRQETIQIILNRLKIYI